MTRGELNALTPFEPPEGANARAYDDHYQRATGTCNVQVVRSVSDWSHGVLTEHSIQNAYIQLIQEANHFIYIGTSLIWSPYQATLVDKGIFHLQRTSSCEPHILPGAMPDGTLTSIYPLKNSLSNASDKGPVVNKIAKALVERILSAAREGKKFKVRKNMLLHKGLATNTLAPEKQVFVVIPEVPGFSGDIEQENAIQIIMAGQWRTINRGGSSIYELIRAAGYDP